MLQVKTYLYKSPIDGIGVFAGEDISKGTIVWRFNPKIDVVLEDMPAMDEIEWDFLKKYAYFDRQIDKWILSADNDRFTNHDEHGNTEPIMDSDNKFFAKSGEVVAVKDIKKGDEITINYYIIDKEALDKLYVPPRPEDKWIFGKIK